MLVLTNFLNFLVYNQVCHNGEKDKFIKQLNCLTVFFYLLLSYRNNSVKAVVHGFFILNRLATVTNCFIDHTFKISFGFLSNGLD